MCIVLPLPNVGCKIWGRGATNPYQIPHLQPKDKHQHYRSPRIFARRREEQYRTRGFPSNSTNDPSSDHTYKSLVASDRLRIFVAQATSPAPTRGDLRLSKVGGLEKSRRCCYPTATSDFNFVLLFRVCPRLGSGAGDLSETLRGTPFRQTVIGNTLGHRISKAISTVGKSKLRLNNCRSILRSHEVRPEEGAAAQAEQAGQVNRAFNPSALTKLSGVS